MNADRPAIEESEPDTCDMTCHASFSTFVAASAKAKMVAQSWSCETWVIRNGTQWDVWIPARTEDCVVEDEMAAEAEADLDAYIADLDAYIAYEEMAAQAKAEDDIDADCGNCGSFFCPMCGG